MPRKKTPSLRDLTRKHFEEEGSARAFLQELSSGSDRACALIGVAALDRVLQDLIATAFPAPSEDSEERVFFGQQAPLASFSSKIDMAEALVLITEDEHAELTRLRRIRNAFAHAAVSLSFDEPLLAKECRLLTLQDREETLARDKATPRQLYEASIRALYLSLLDDTAVHYRSKIQTFRKELSSLIEHRRSKQPDK